MPSRMSARRSGKKGAPAYMSAAPHYHVLCINLPDATERWARVAAWIEHDVLADGRRGTLHRVPATDGRAGPGALPAACVARMGLVARDHVLARPEHIVDPYELDSAAAVACYDSHWRCWRWLAEEAPAGCWVDGGEKDGI